MYAVSDAAMDLALPAAVIVDGRETPAEQIRLDVARVAAGLSERFVGAGDGVIVSLPNSYEFVVVNLALELLGAVTVNLPVGFRREVGQVVRMVDARLCVMHHMEDIGLYGDLRRYVSLETQLEPLLGDPSRVQAAQRRPEDRTWLAVTSGSTGTPRAAVHTRLSLEASTRAMAERYGLGADDVLFAAAPVGHAIGFCYGVRLACTCGARLVLQSKWNAEAAVALIDGGRCTFAAIPTPFLADLLDVKVKPRQGTLRHLLVGGAPVARDQVAAADLIFGHGVTSGYYGA
ncbi:MAG: AMP-binding protein, partial [Gaiellaceae bacterium]